MKLTLPEPTADEQAHSAALVEIILDEIKTHGQISFRRYMEMCLYQPSLGYYVAGAKKFGTGGDFTTAPEISPLFGYCLANQAADVLRELTDDGTVLEIGAGTGALAASMLQRFQDIECLPKHYFILELGTELQQRQRETIEREVPELLDRVVWLDSLDDFSMSGIIVANELLDAMPVRCFTLEAGQIYERVVKAAAEDSNESFIWGSEPADQHLMAVVNELPLGEIVEPYRSEINPQLKPWFASISRILNKGVALLIDYGYERADYYHPQRNDGTLICHYRQRVVNEPFYLPGLMDITANVDFTAVVESGTEAGLDFSGYTNQASFLFGAGLDHIFASVAGEDEQQRLELSAQIKMLTLPGEMGDRFKVIGFSRNFDHDLGGFGFNDLSYRL